jgi:hypothetical protein
VGPKENARDRADLGHKPFPLKKSTLTKNALTPARSRTGGY